MSTEIGAYRNDGPDTMRAGANAIAPKLVTLRARVLVVLRAARPNGLTDTEILSVYRAAWGGGEYRSLSTRRRELVDQGYVTRIGTRLNPITMVSNIVWGATTKVANDPV